MKITKLLESNKIKEDISSVEPVVKFQGKSSHTFTKDKKWEVDFDEAGNIVARTRHGKLSYFKGHINDKVNDFPSSDEDNIILAAREQHGLKFGNKEVKEGWYEGHLDAIQRKTSGYDKCYKIVKKARTSNPIDTNALDNARDHFGYDLYKMCLEDVLKEMDNLDEDIDYSKFRNMPDLIPYTPVEDNKKWQYSVGGVDVPYTSYEEAKAHLKDDYKITNYRDELQKYIDEETGRPHTFFVDETFDGRLCIDINHGDWKHEHWYADSLVKKFFMGKGLGVEIEEDVTLENGSDTYSACHYYEIDDIMLSGRAVEESLLESNIKHIYYHNSPVSGLKKGQWVDVKEENGKLYGKWSFEGDDGWHEITNVEEMPYHNFHGARPAKTFVWGGWRHWLDDEVEKFWDIEGKRVRGDFEIPGMPHVKRKLEDMNEAAECKVRFYQVFEVPKSPKENGKMIGQRGTLKDAIAFGDKRTGGRNNFLVKAVCNDGTKKYVDFNHMSDDEINELGESIKTFETKAKNLNEDRSNNTMTVLPLSGLNADGFTVVIKDASGEEIFNKEYRYGTNASYNRKFARWAEQDVENAKKYNWKTPYALKPYVADIIEDLCSKYGIDKNTIEFAPGKNVFAGGNVSDAFVDRMKKKIFEIQELDEASYGGAFDIADDEYFTREDIETASEKVLDHVNETFSEEYVLGGTWFEDGNWIVNIQTQDGMEEYEVKVPVSMRRIRKPSDIEKYVLEVSSKLIAQIKEYNGLDEAFSGEYSDKFYKLAKDFEVDDDVQGLRVLADDIIRYCPEEDVKDCWYDRGYQKRQQDEEDRIAWLNSDDELDEDYNSANGWEYQPAGHGSIPEYNKEYSDRLLGIIIPPTDEYVKYFAALYDNSIADYIYSDLTRFDVDDESALFDSMEAAVKYLDAEASKALNNLNIKADGLNEDYDGESEKGPDEGADAGIADLLSTAIIDEWEAIKEYNDLAINARAEGFDDVATIIDDINTEENIHVGQLQQALTTISPNAVVINQGQQEARDQLSGESTNEIDDKVEIDDIDDDF